MEDGEMHWVLRFLAFQVVLRFANSNDVFIVGYNDYGQLGVGDILQRSTQTMLGSNLPLTLTKGVAAGLYHNLAFGDTDSEENIVYSWGRNTKGQLGLGTVTSSLIPQRVSWVSCPIPSSWTCSPSYCVDQCGGKCSSYGSSNPFWAQSDLHCMKPQDCLWSSSRAEPNIIQVSAGQDTSYAVTDTGNVYSWGSNDWGQLGISDFEEEHLDRPDGKWIRDVPMLLRTFVRLQKRIISVAAGAYHALALEDNNQVWSWGSNAEGQLAVGDLSQRSTPVDVEYFKAFSVVQVAAGAYHSLFLTDTSNVFAAGLNDEGQLGLGDTHSRQIPVLVAFLVGKNISSIAAGDYASYAITDFGQVYSWGSNVYSQLGVDLGNSTFSSVPQLIQRLVDVSAVIFRVYGGQRHAFALDQSGDVYAMGNNDFGMLGLGDETQRTVPTFISALKGRNIYSIASGAYHTVAVSGCWDLPMPCSGHGTCDSTGACVCDTGYDGYRCDSLCPGGIGNKCSLNGDCVVPDVGKSFCICYPGYTGTDCSKQCPGGSDNVCSGNGVCLSDGTCLCDSGWSGALCADPCPGTMSSPCSDLGVCKNGHCTCFTGFAGDNCSVECDGGAYNPCSYHGVCQSNGKCICDPGFRKFECSCECPGGAANECGGRGVCDDVCSCNCRQGYRGSNCSLDCPGAIPGYLDGLTVLLRVCSGHGECDSSAHCICYEGWGGGVCEIGPFDWTWVYVVSAVGGFLLCVLACLLERYRRIVAKRNERLRKRAARKRLQSKQQQQKKKDKMKSFRSMSSGIDRSKRKGKQNR